MPSNPPSLASETTAPTADEITKAVRYAASLIDANAIEFGHAIDETVAARLDWLAAALPSLQLVPLAR